MRYGIITGLLMLCLAFPAAAEEAAEDPYDFRQASVEGAEVFIISPMDGATVTSPVTVQFGLKGMGIAPAGVDIPGTGHHHLLINEELPNLMESMPMSDGLIHYGGGQTQATIDLPPGTHTLQLILGDMNHIPHKPPVISEKITIVVE
ncbi:MAG: DUF4399 domain-containing protein [Alphaproteobacteria bacterium]